MRKVMVRYHWECCSRHVYYDEIMGGTVPRSKNRPKKKWKEQFSPYFWFHHHTPALNTAYLTRHYCIPSMKHYGTFFLGKIIRLIITE